MLKCQWEIFDLMKIVVLYGKKIEQYNNVVRVGNIGTALQLGYGITPTKVIDELIEGELVEFGDVTIHISLNSGS
jgi:hypothetical protein